MYIPLTVTKCFEKHQSKASLYLLQSLSLLSQRLIVFSRSDLQENETRVGPGEGPRALRQADTYKECGKSAG